VEELWDVSALVGKLDEGKGHHFHPDLFKDHPNHRGGTPVVHAVVVDIVVNLWNLITDPGWDHFVAVFVDFQMYGFMPLQGGYQAPQAHAQYAMDWLAYEDAGVTETYLFKQSSNMFKDTFWQVMGMWSRVTEAALAKTEGFMDTYLQADREGLTEENIEDYNENPDGFATPEEELAEELDL